ncbi:MAG TPA: FAD binding domain-containing protein, partial [Limnochordia bacterium]|nr:FAD binding domain-containing protein [Limnochordia bacterium]
MIPFEFEYLRPKSVRAAVGAFQQLTAAGKRPIYYAGGTEIVTGARQNKVRMDAVIDLKGIPELVEHGRDGDRLRFGAATSLSAITEANAWPLLSDCLGRIADHTSRVQITL